ncbi:MAG: Hsp20/alpha crystallin family protein [Candidatus Aenigmarchaeota archaeon]|nr:Hsp20/alpha crystallin family protein [Candidatus Aenigmarchaeota archaeon]
MEKKPRFYWEEPKGGNMKIEMPGFRKDEISAKIEGGMLTISAAKKSHREKKGKGFYAEESSSSSFTKSISLPEGVKAGDISLEIRDGVVVIKKKKKAKS